MTLNETLRNRHLILASGSPRRQQFLKDLGLPFEIRLKPVEETYPENLTAPEIVTYLAALKTRPYQNELGPKDLLITGDTIVCRNNRVLGKPETEKEAFAMLKDLSGKAHQVLSSVCLYSTEKQQTFYDTTTVFFSELRDEDINDYINTHNPFDKAGAYGIQEWIGKIGIERIEGSYYTVMGMPLHKVYKALLRF